MVDGRQTSPEEVAASEVESPAGDGGEARHSSETAQRLLRMPNVWLVPVLLGVVVRILYWVLITPNWVPNADADQYLRLGRALADGDGYSLVFPQLHMHATAFRPPLYPALLAVPAWLFGDDVLWPSRLLSLLISLGVIAAAAVFVRRIAGRLAGLVAGCTVAVLPNLLANDTVTLTEPLALLLLLGLLLALDSRRPVVAGLLTGLLFLTRPNAYLVLVVVIVVVWRTIGWRRAAIALGCCAAVVLPWLVRNQIQVGTFRLVTSDGFTMAAIYGPPAIERGGFVDPVFDPWYKTHLGGDFKILQFDEAEWTERLSSLAISTAREHPGAVVNVVRHNIMNVLELETAANRGADHLDGRNVEFARQTLPIHYLLLVVGTAGLVSQARNRRMWPAFGIVGGMLVLSLLLVAPPRLRSPLDLLLCMGVGFAATLLASLRTHDRSVLRNTTDPLCSEEQNGGGAQRNGGST